MNTSQPVHLSFRLCNMHQPGTCTIHTREVVSDQTALPCIESLLVTFVNILRVLYEKATVHISEDGWVPFQHLYFFLQLTFIHSVFSEKGYKTLNMYQNHFFVMGSSVTSWPSVFQFHGKSSRKKNKKRNKGIVFSVGKLMISFNCILAAFFSYIFFFLQAAR